MRYVSTVFDLPIVKIISLRGIQLALDSDVGHTTSKKERERGKKERTLSVFGLWRSSLCYHRQSRVHRGYPVSPPSRQASMSAQTNQDHPDRPPSAQASTLPSVVQPPVCAVDPAARNSRSRTRSHTSWLRPWTHCRIPLGCDGVACGRYSQRYVLCSMFLRHLNRIIGHKY